MYKISVIIRTYNEGKHIREVLESLKNQTFKNFQIIIVDSESTDTTLSIAKEYNCKIVKIKKSRFNYSYASNIGAINSDAEILCFLSGHSVPVNNNYLDLIYQAFNNSQVGGVYGEVIALQDGSITEKIFYNLGYYKSKYMKKLRDKMENKIHPGILSCSNAAIRKAIWIEHPFTEYLGHGGEDVEMAYYIIKNKKYILHLPNALVRHSHGSSFHQFRAEYKNWGKLYSDVIKYIGEYYD